ncbi:aminoglycoside phosphotransferase family protein [Conexibacter sp. JD483]|uniref:aminoglycoside phosphotransferase family protein n=1 Tax=unclassified Conexibacter TaxID=2627773 RepID=UPI002723E5D8|nr:MULTISPECIES: aminoglycoside phosphotransferase family protein [unclassified Conexibacter]MDO8188816.1 aminoglycoside phosphotransferase family protein [Conexibacter sp. CPCC 205706]MDO8201661.1 aminoglycoside phosphotransferase family protein [Conexibacter sp. CPCC 205762]MDR9371345.1 aminoglycoside phosphotransferase family protein [Conexibacter sp. JD483]
MARTEREGPPVPRLLRADTDAGALLLEAIVPGRALLADPAPPLPEACGALLRALAAPAPPDELPALGERVEWIFELWLARRAAEPGPRAAVPEGLLERGRAAARELIADGAAPVALVHGDLHPGNVLDGGPARGLVAIDPRPCAGDPAFDAVDLVLHGVEQVAVARERIALVAAHAGGDADRIAGWCAALAALDAAALAARDTPPAPAALATLRALAA